MPPARSRSVLSLFPVLTLIGAPISAFAQDNLLENGSFESGLTGWTSSGQVFLQNDAWDGSRSVRLEPAEQLTAELSQVVTGLIPTGRYTIAARIRTTIGRPRNRSLR